MKRNATTALLAAAVIAGAMSVVAAGDVVEYENAADDWLTAVAGLHEISTFAWEQFYPGPPLTRPRVSYQV